MKQVHFAALILALILPGTTGTLIAQYGSPQGPPHSAYRPGPEYGPSPEGGWDVAPQEFREFQRLGFHDGIEGARKDMENYRRPNVNNRDEFRKPQVPGSVRHEYREAFRRGYSIAIQHMLGGPYHQY